MKINELLARMSALKSAACSEEVRGELRAALSHRSNLVVERAARAIRSHGLVDCIEPLIAAYGRFFTAPVTRDPLCRAKLALVETLDDLACRDPGIYLRGVHHVQLEPTYGGKTDTAVRLRAASALGLAHTGYPDVYLELTALLNDAEPGARAGAARALAWLGTEQAELLLRMRVLAGDREPDNYGTYFSALAGIAPERSVPFIGGFLDADDSTVADEAALALGESRTHEAFELLRDKLARTFRLEEKKLLMTALSLLRSDEAAETLLEMIRGDEVRAAGAALQAMRPFAAMENMAEKIRTVVLERNDPALRKALDTQDVPAA